MSLLDKIKKEIILAMKAKDNIKRDILRLIKGEIERGGKHATDEFITKIIKKTVAGIEETKGEGHEAQLEVLNPFLPSQLSEEEIGTIIVDLITEKGFSGKKDLGLVMRHFKENLGGQYDGKVVSKVAAISLT
jgi:uncharacterized protein YqeY